MNERMSLTIKLDNWKEKHFWMAPQKQKKRIKVLKAEYEELSTLKAGISLIQL